MTVNEDELAKRHESYHTEFLEQLDHVYGLKMSSCI